MRKNTGLTLAATLVAAGLTAVTVPAALASDTPFKRNEDLPDVVTTVDDDDDDDDSFGGRSGATNTRSGDASFDSGTGNSNDGTNSRVSAVSRDRDLSRDDRTKDRTRDGQGPMTRDWSQDSTNDRSRNDTR